MDANKGQCAGIDSVMLTILTGTYESI